MKKAPKEIFRTSGKDGYSIVTVFLSNGTWYDLGCWDEEGFTEYTGKHLRGCWKVVNGEVWLTDLDGDEYHHAIEQIQQPWLLATEKKVSDLIMADD